MNGLFESSAMDAMSMMTEAMGGGGTSRGAGFGGGRTGARYNKIDSVPMPRGP